jgi:poly(A) polymerase
MVLSIMERLRFSKRCTRRVYSLVRNHMVNYSRSWTDRAVRRFARKNREHLQALLALASADRRAQRPDSARDSLIQELSRRIERLRHEGQVDPYLPVTGRDIMEVLGIGEGPEVGKAKTFLLDQAGKKGRPMSRGDAVSLLKRWAKRSL